ncbi:MULTISPECIES: helix-turn-helix domain-containing protein [unclassified Mycobacterium]|uniref:helix-turn-helix domain-containing protein n=1 Tax=unclassified Mycobacterium TaxID=2642494 RepID=UPI0009E7C188|nr:MULTISPECIES: helix-turn-helix domain-containing protein [unclassified Mycobacterium]
MRLTLHQAAERVGLSEKTLRRYVSDGRLRAYRVGARAIRIDTADLDALSRPIGGD